MNSDFFKNLPKATRLLLIINVALFALAAFVPDMRSALALHYYESSLFQPHQLLTHFFMHANLSHLFFNMYALVLFGSVVENQLGLKRFAIVYGFSAVGAFALNMGVTWYQLSGISPEVYQQLLNEGGNIVANGQNYVDEYLGSMNAKFNGSMVGASGALMGILVGYAVLFPNHKLGIIFIPVYVPAKYFVPFFILIDLYLGVAEFSWDNIAHFAHIGGAIIGLFLVLLWKKKGLLPSPFQQF